MCLWRAARSSATRLQRLQTVGRMPRWQRDYGRSGASAVAERSARATTRWGCARACARACAGGGACGLLRAGQGRGRAGRAVARRLAGWLAEDTWLTACSAHSFATIIAARPALARVAEAAAPGGDPSPLCLDRAQLYAAEGCGVNCFEPAGIVATGVSACTDACAAGARASLLGRCLITVFGGLCV